MEGSLSGQLADLVLDILLEAKIFTSKRKNVAFCYFFIATNRIYFTLFRLEELIESCFNSYFSFWIKKRNFVLTP